MKKSEIDNLIHSMVATIVLDLFDILKDKDCFVIMDEFSKSRTFKNLFNYKTELWKESPDYIIEEYFDEIHISKDILKKDTKTNKKVIKIS